MEVNVNNVTEFIIGSPALRKNMYQVKFDGVDIPPYLINKVKIFNIGEKIIFKCDIFEIPDLYIKIDDLFKITGGFVEYFDHKNEVIGGIRFEVEGINFKKKLSYYKEGLMLTKLRLIIKDESIKVI